MGHSDESICETHIVNRACRERFLPLEHPGCAPLGKAHVSLAGVSSLQKCYRIARIKPRYHVVVYTVGGEGTLRTAGMTASVTTGSLLVLPAETTYEYSLASSAWNMVWFHLGRRRMWSGIASSAPWFAETSSGHVVFNACEALLSESRSVASRSANIVELQASLIREYLLRDLCAPASSEFLRHEEPLRLLWRKVEESLDERWSVEKLAREVHLAPGYFHRVVAELNGTTPMRMVAELRMQHAQSLIRYSNLTLAEVASKVGYNDQFAFSVAFRRWAGKPPSTFRE